MSRKEIICLIGFILAGIVFGAVCGKLFLDHII